MKQESHYFPMQRPNSISKKAQSPPNSRHQSQWPAEALIYSNPLVEPITPGIHPLSTLLTGNHMAQLCEEPHIKSLSSRCCMVCFQLATKSAIVTPSAVNCAQHAAPTQKLLIICVNASAHLGNLGGPNSLDLCSTLLRKQTCDPCSLKLCWKESKVT